MTRKTCRTCGCEKDDVEFNWHTREKGVRQTTCRECFKAYQRAYYAANRAKIRAKREEDPERLAKMRRYGHDRRLTLEGFLAAFLSTKKNQCRRDKILCTITLDDLLALYKYQRGRCAITRRVLEWGSGERTPFRLSLDRLDAVYGYIPGNIRFLTLHANLARAEFSDRCLQLLAQDVMRVMGPLYEPDDQEIVDVPEMFDWYDRKVMAPDGFERWVLPISGIGEMHILEYGTRKRVLSGRAAENRRVPLPSASPGELHCEPPDEGEPG